MKVKVVDRTASVAWSPQHQYPIYLAAGTAAQQVDASFSTTAALELYSLNLNEPGCDMVLKSTTPSDNRFHKITWGSHAQSSGTIVGGCDGGVIQIYNVTKLINGEPSLMTQKNKHKGPVKGLDFNSFQSNLLASAASESEIYIWDLNNPASPMTPGSKSQPLEDITSVAWNKQVQHILASAFSTRCVIWDLRKNDPIIKLTDNAVRTKWNVVVWNPDIATQLCLGSEDDQNPVIQLWDLRFATSPLKVFGNHQRGVLSVSWCQQDTDMLLSCGRDNKIICWNPNNNQPGEDIVCEFLLTNQWNFDVSWCPRNPALFACSSFDGHVNIYSLIGGSHQVQTSNKIADSFPGMELYAQAPITMAHTVPVNLKKTPKWLKKPVGAKFGFGGKLVSFENVINTNHEVANPRAVYVSQVITEPQLVSQSNLLEAAIQSSQYAEFCQNKILQSVTNHDKMIWQFLAANFEISPRVEFLNLLGFKKEELMGRMTKVLDKSPNAQVNQMKQITNRMASLGKSTDSESDLDGGDDVIGQQNFILENDLSFCTSDVKSENSEGSYPNAPFNNFKISVGDDIDGLISEALLLGNIESAVELCLQDKRMADAIVLAMAGGSELLAKTQYAYFQQSKGPLSKLISAVATEDWSQVVRSCSVESWKEALAAAVTHANDQEFPILCEILGERLENEKNGAFSNYAEICYICSGNLSKVVNSWLKREKAITADHLQNLFELIMILKKALEAQGVQVEMTGRLAILLSSYAEILVSQGKGEMALSFLENSNDELIENLKNRLNMSMGKYQKSSKKPIGGDSLTKKARGIAPGFYPPHRVQDDVITAPPLPQHNFNLNPLHGKATPTPTPNTFGSTPYVPVPPMAPGAAILPPQPAAAPPPPPPNNKILPSPSPGPGGLTSRAKHVLDPSVQPTSFHSNYYSQPQYQPPVFPQPVYSNASYNSAGYPPEAFNPPVGNPTPPPPPPSSSTYSSVSQPPGWNDPPIVDSSRNFLYSSDPFHSRGLSNESSAEHAGTRKWKTIILKNSQPKSDFAQKNPITQPLLGGPTGDSVANGQILDPYRNPGMQPYRNQTMPPQTQMNPSQFQSFSNQQPPYPQFPSANVPRVNLQESPAANPRPKPATPEPVKRPIPKEHVCLQTLFDDLKDKCAMAANNPQSKRKLEEVSKKLEVLYDGLRNDRLSKNTLQGLHLIAQHVQAGDYANGLMLHTQLVSGPDFSQIASFMPGIKVLLQTALQLQTYL